jgi:hypothetical protein
MRTGLLVLVGVAVGILVAHLRAGPRDEPLPAIPTTSSTRWRAVAAPTPVVQRELSPADPRYNPVALLRESAGELSPQEIFAAEPRDPARAPVFETRVKDAITSALDELNLSAKVKSITTECKTLSCETRVEVSADDAVAIYNEISGIMLGETQAPLLGRDGDTGYVTFTNLYTAGFWDEPYHQTFLDGAYRPAIEAAKQRAAP